MSPNEAAHILADAMKICRKCKESKADDTFPKRGQRCLKCVYEREKIRRAKNLDKYKATMKAWKPSGPCYKCGIERGKAEFTKLKNLCKPCKTINDRGYREKNRQRLNEQKYKYVAVHREARKKICRESYARNIDKHMAKMHRRRTRMTSAAVPYLFADIIMRDKGICWICKTPVLPHQRSRDHLIPLVNGGPDVFWNVALAHRLCNIKRGRGGFPAGYILTLDADEPTRSSASVS